MFVCCEKTVLNINKSTDFVIYDDGSSVFITTNIVTGLELCRDSSKEVRDIFIEDFLLHLEEGASSNYDTKERLSVCRNRLDFM